jgi:hypothetical protein
LSVDERLHFYELFAHNLTVSIRGMFIQKDILNEERLERIQLINEILHRVTSKVWVIRLHTNGRKRIFGN